MKEVHYDERLCGFSLLFNLEKTSKFPLFWQITRNTKLSVLQNVTVACMLGNVPFHRLSSHSLPFCEHLCVSMLLLVCISGSDVCV